MTVARACADDDDDSDAGLCAVVFACAMCACVALCKVMNELGSDAHSEDIKQHTSSHDTYDYLRDRVCCVRVECI